MKKRQQKQPEDTFVIGLTMAGAVSGGAYTAGVLDFLIEALDAWEAKKQEEADLPRDQKTVPTHKVLLQAASGASAGSMCTAILGFALPFNFPPVRWNQQALKDQNEINGKDNPFFNAWVESINIKDMLKTDDLKDGKLPSLLNSQPVDDILQKLLNFSAPLKLRPYVEQPFTMRLAVTNLRGISYNVSMKGNSGAGHQMRTHSDRMNFVLGSANAPSSLMPPELDSAIQLKSPISATCENWQTFGYAALASGAFPFFLKPRLLQRDQAEYDKREFMDISGKPSETEFVPPDWSANVSNPFNFYCMDGGLMDNEPFELARQVLSGSPWNSNPRDGDKANRAVIIIDPFVEDSAIRNDCGGDDTRKDKSEGKSVFAPLLTDFLMPMFDALVSNNRFKPNELALAHNPDVFSRYLVAPSRGDMKPAPHSPLAAGGLGNFLGFCHRSYRVHDYLLGRRNCQKFLKEHFTLLDTNPIIKQGYGEESANVPLPMRHFLEDGIDGQGKPRSEYPIIPLVGHLYPITDDMAEPLPKWPIGKFNPEDIKALIAGRLDAIVSILMKQVVQGTPDKDQGLWALVKGKVKGSVGGFIAICIWGMKRSGVVDSIMKTLRQSLTNQKL